jgi:outer membrane protein insertion porin family
LTAAGQDLDTLPVIDYGKEQTFEIGKIDVVGAEYSDDNALIGVSGLKVGDVIRIPGRHLPDAIRSIYQLSLFTQVDIVATQIVGDVAFLEIRVKERPRYLSHTFKGVKEGIHEDLTAIVERHIRRNSILTENSKRNLSKGLKTYFEDKGYLDAEITILEEPFPKRPNAVRLIFDIDRKKRVKVGDIIFNDNASTNLAHLNKKLKDGKLRKKFKNTKRKRKFLAKSKYVKADYEEDKKAMMAYYNTLGLRDAEIASDSVYRNEKGDIIIVINMDEGRQYYFRNITWEGNTIYPDVTLATVLGIQKGDVYNPELLDKQLRFSQDSRDVSSLYMDEGYLFFNIDPIQVAIVGDSVDLEMRIYEGPQATIDKVVINGNDRTHEHVIRRTLRTNPGEKFSRTQLIRSQREIIALGYFDPEQLGMNTPVNQQRGTVDIEYDLVERPSDQLELSAGYNGSAGLLGTIGVTFNNFSTRRMFEKGAWRPVPMGDGQKLSLRGQSNGSFFRSVNFSFTEPWFGGKKPNSLSVGGFYTTQALLTTQKQSPLYSELRAIAGYVGLGKRLKFPDDYFYFNSNVYLQNYKLLQNVIEPSSSQSTFRFKGNPIYSGSFNNFYVSLTVGRSSINEPLFPTRGSKFSLTAQLTPPYSLFKEDNFWKLNDAQSAEVIAFENMQRDNFGVPGDLDEAGERAVLFNAETAKRFNYLEYHKWRFDAEWYNQLVGKLVLRSAVKLGFLGYYDKNIGVSPFERYQLGGDGLSNQNAGIQGIDQVRLRGYEISDVSDRTGDGIPDDVENAVIFNKYEFELRYPISTNPNSTIYALSFLEGGNSWTSFSDYQPFDLRRSAGLGLRVFLPVFGLIGFDYGWGFDKPYLDNTSAGAGKYAKFGLIIGFEPD